MQWLLYGNHPSPVAFTGMTIVLVAGLYGVVSETTFLSRDPDQLQIYGPADTHKERTVDQPDSETTLLLPEDEEQTVQEIDESEV
jgi:hypothetical protein